jgi:hypothetical protein
LTVHCGHGLLADIWKNNDYGGYSDYIFKNHKSHSGQSLELGFIQFYSSTQDACRQSSLEFHNAHVLVSSVHSTKEQIWQQGWMQDLVVVVVGWSS